MGEILSCERFRAVVRGEAADAGIVENLSHLLGVAGGPIEIGSVEFDAFVAHLCDCHNGAHEILLQLIADGVEFEADWDLPLFCRGRRCTCRGG